MAITVAMRTQVSQLYVSLFGRAPDGEGLGYWVTQLDSGKTVAQVAQDMYNVPAARAYYPAFATNEEVVATFYQNVLGRAVGTDTEGQAFWVAKMNASGATKGSVISEMLNVVANYAGTDAAGVASKALFNNKVAVAQYYGEQNGSIAGATTALATVTADVATVATAKAAALTSATASTGSTFTLTTGLDTVAGTTGNDTIVGSFDGAATSTSNLGDTVDGGAGTDTVRITSNAAATVVPTLTNVENLIIVDTVQESRDVSLNTALTSLELSGGTTINGATVTATLAAGQKLTLTGITDGDAAAATVADGGISIATGATVASVDLTVAGVGTTAGVTATANDALVVGVAGTGVTTLNITASGTNNIGLLNAGAALTTVNINSSGATTFWGTNAATITTVNASASTGAVTYDASGATGADQTITGGSAADTLTADLAVNLALNAGAGNDVVVLANATAANLASTTGAADSINGGEGTDTLQVIAADAASLVGDTAADRAVITGFEQLRVSDDLNASAFSIAPLGFNTLQIDVATTTAAATVSGFTSGATVEYRANTDSTGANGQVNVGMTGATNAGTPDDLLNIKLNANIGNQALAADAIEFRVGVAGINKLVVTTADRVNTDGATTRDDGYILTLASDNSVTSLTASGSSELSFASSASTAALVTINAADLAGDLIVDLSTNGLNQGVTVTGGAGTNTITGTGFGDVITGGARADTITLGAGADSATGGAGADTFVVVAADFTAATAAALAAAADSITDFAKASDIIDNDATISFVTNATAATGTAAINAEGIASFAAADDTLAERITAVEAAINAGGVAAAGQSAVFEFGADTYVFISEGTNGVGAGDALIKLVGVTGLSDTTITGANLLIA